MRKTVVDLKSNFLISSQFRIFAPSKLGLIKIYSFLLVLLTLNSVSVYAQKINLGLHIEPVYSWMSSSDVEIRGGGGQLGFKMGVTGEYVLSTKWSIAAGTNLSLNQGGTLIYTTGGNFWPNSELKVPQYNIGQKPVPDNSLLEYHLQYWEANLGIKYRIEQDEIKTIAIELPQFGVHRLLQARGSIHNNKELTTGENIMPDIEPVSFSLTTGIGIEKRISRSTRVFGSIRYQCFFSDVTLNKGFKSHFVSHGNTGDPKDDIYTRYIEKSNTFIHSLGFRLGLLF